MIRLHFDVGLMKMLGQGVRRDRVLKGAHPREGVNRHVVRALDVMKLEVVELAFGSAHLEAIGHHLWILPVEGLMTR